MNPTREQADHFALMLASGMPSMEVMSYFLPESSGPQEIEFAHNRWVRSKEIQAAILRLQGKAWQELPLEDRIRLAIERHYSEMAYFLYTHNYGSLSGSEKQKADTCRQALEAKIAGMAGKMDAITRFWDDVQSGKISLKTAIIPQTNSPSAH